MLNGIIEIAICLFHHERKNIAGFTATKTFVKIPVHRYFERWCFFIVKWTMSDIIRSGTF